MVVSASRTTQSAGSASRSAPGKAGRDGASARAGTAASCRTFSGWAAGCAQAEPGSSASSAARTIFFISGNLLIDTLHVQAAAFQHGLDRDPPRQMAGADREQ